MARSVAVEAWEMVSIISMLGRRSIERESCLASATAFVVCSAHAVVDKTVSFDCHQTLFGMLRDRAEMIKMERA